MRALGTLLLVVSLLAGLTLSCDYNEPVAPSIGAITVTTKTFGAEIDEDGYEIRLDGGASLRIGFTGNLAFIALEAGDHSLLLDGVASNCQVSGENPRPVKVPPELTINIALEVFCTATRGFLEISTVTSGDSPDSDGYSVALNARPFGAVSDAGGLLRIFTDAATHEVALSGIASNCHVKGENPRPVVVSPPATARITFQVVCLPPPRSRIVFGRTFTNGAQEIWTMARDGSLQQSLTFNEPGRALRPSWSPDGTLVLFMRDRIGGAPGHDIVIMNANGSDPTPLAPGELNTTPWSPDGQRIVFTRIVSPLGEPAVPQVGVVHPNGSGARILTDDVLPSFDPAWSPDGSLIAFTRDTRIFLMSTDGSAQRAVTNPATGERDREARWSPDGSRLAFVRERASGRDLWTFNSDGSDPRRLTADIGTIGGYSWGPDGERLTFSDRFDVYTIRRDGSSRTNLTNSPQHQKYEPSWSPDGSSILYSADVGPVRDVFVVDVNDHSIRNLTNWSGANWTASEQALWQP